MKPAARYQSAITILDAIIDGDPADKALLNWARGSRFAGSKDRAAVRDIVFDALRRRSSFATRFGDHGRGLALGRAQRAGELDMFSGEGYAPTMLTADENANLTREIAFANPAQELDYPEFLYAELSDQYGDGLDALMASLRERAPVELRVNVLKTTRTAAIGALGDDGITAAALGSDEAAIVVTSNARRVHLSDAYENGYVEFQDQSSQMIARMAAGQGRARVLDYCAGGGGKTLALGMHMGPAACIDAWDIDAARMADIPKRAKRAGQDVNILTQRPDGDYDLVFVDAPCSGSGAWRRNPDTKWRLSPERLDELQAIQADVLEQASARVVSGGRLVYATCSILANENQNQVDAFLLAHDDFTKTNEMTLNPLNAGDGFYGAVLVRT